LNRHRAIVITIFLGLAPLSAGCGKRTGVERFPVYGTVKFANGDKFSGTISFQPERGPAANTGVTNGTYKFDRNNGPVAGKQTVKFKPLISRSRIPEPPPKNNTLPATKTEWSQSTEVSNDGQNLHDFTLEN